MSTALILGDVHLGKGITIGKAGIGTALNSRIVDQVNLLDWTLDQALDHHVQRIIITGDIFEDPKPHPAIITLFVSWVKKVLSYDIKLDIIKGNHDILRTGTFYTSPLDILAECDLDGCSIYGDINTIIVDSTAFTFLPFRDRKSFNVESNQDALDILRNTLMYEVSAIPLPYTKVLIGHLALEGSIWVGDEVDDLSNELFVTVDMLEGYDFVWMGHVHKPQVIRKEPLVAHIGSMDTSNFGETDHKKHIVLFDTDTSTYIKLEIPTRGLSKIVISVPKDTANTTEYVLGEIKKSKLDLKQSIVKLEVSLSTADLKPVNRSEIEKFLYKEGAFNIAGFSESKKIGLVKRDGAALNNIDTTMDVPAAIKMWAKKKWPDDVDAVRRQKFIETAVNIHNDFKAGVKV